ncbi:MAG: AAA family ATPase [Dysgonamonadaceae bacterium]|jgi:superfamily I DNA and/or RNA helicase|nr:AAA family ATPase [Dysgonamonadaceae bacterium]
MENQKLLTVRFTEYCDGIFLCVTPDGESLKLRCSERQTREMNELAPFKESGNKFNLLNISLLDDDFHEAEFLIFEPDYLLDVSSLAECFKAYGHHYLNFTLSRLHRKENTPAILLGNTANFFIDEFVNINENQSVNYTEAIKRMFRTSAFEFSACEDLKNRKTEHDFFESAATQFANIRLAVSDLFPKAGLDAKKIVLEPSFICNALGLQGRLDLMASDFSAFVELKSGKAVEDFRSGGTFIRSAENHYTQMLLYLAILEFNQDLQPEDVRSYLLYSKYPLLSREAHSRQHLADVLQVRNRIVAAEYALQAANDISVTEEHLAAINSKTLNKKGLSGKFFDNYLAPPIDRFAFSFANLNEMEKAYFLRVYTFLIKELWTSKVGEREYEGQRKASVLWNAPFEDKIAAGELLYNLKISDNRASEESHSLVLEIPEYPDLYLPNFRAGDAVVLYERNSGRDSVNNRQVFKGSIESIESQSITIRLRYRQKNREVWNEAALYAVEHDYQDTVFNGMFRGLAAFLQANENRRKLLLPTELNNSKSNDNKPEQRPEIFLLAGPPGTGKTSIALKKMVEDELANDGSNILLLAYTNRAVDEICKTLSSIENARYIRIGSELNCAPEFRPCLLENELEKCNSRNDVENAVRSCRLFVGTAASVGNKPELFSLKRFDLAIIDEATQLLEPQLLGFICAQEPSGRNAIKRFVLIGDYKQLPAITLQERSESEVSELILNRAGITNLSDSLFERLYRKYSSEGLTGLFGALTRQGRMHPEIAEFPSKFFYEGKLEPVGLPHQNENWEKNRMEFFDIKPSKSDFSEKSNQKEAEKAVEICKQLYEADLQAGKTFEPESVGIITPFRNQIALIRKLLFQSGIEPLAQIGVDTVERFQGSQRDTIIYSFCIKKQSQLLALPNCTVDNGFSIDRKLNVALTRARKQLFVIGNSELLCKNEIYKKLMEHIVNKPVIIKSSDKNGRKTGI